MPSSDMDALELLQQRNSAPKLCEPGPDEETLEQMFRAATRAPDHANLRPWRFIVFRGEARNQLGDIYAEALAKRNPEAGEDELDKARAKALRAPLVIAVAVRIKKHPKVPPIEQRLSAGCAAYGLLLAAEAKGFAGIWRTGGNAFDRNVMDALGLDADEELVGFLYFGSRDGRAKPLPEHNLDTFVKVWPA